MCGGGDYGLSCGSSKLPGSFSRSYSCGGGVSYTYSESSGSCGGGSSKTVSIERNITCGGYDGYTLTRVTNSGVCSQEVKSIHLTDDEVAELFDIVQEKRRNGYFRK